MKSEIAKAAADATLTPSNMGVMDVLDAHTEALRASVHKTYFKLPSLILPYEHFFKHIPVFC